MKIPRRWVHTVALVVVRVAAVLVPGVRRAAWRREWESELWHAVGQGDGSDEVEWRKGLRWLHRTLGAFRHAYHERREEVGMKRWLEDLRFGVRILSRRGGWTLLAAATLAVATGTTTAMFAVVDGVLLRPLPFPAPDRLVAAVATFDSESGVDERPRVSLPAFDQFTRSQDVLSALAAYSGAGLILDLGGGAEVVAGARVSDNFFTTLGVSPVLGRGFEDGDDDPGAPAVVVVSKRFWEARLEADPDVLSRTLSVQGREVPIVGVMPDGVILPSQRTDVWLSNSGFPRVAGLHSHRMVGRLRDGVSLDAAAAPLRAARGDIPVSPGVMGDLHLKAVPLRDMVVGSSRLTLLGLAGATLLLLTIAGVNLGNLYLVRSDERAAEVAVRAALGASRGRLARQFASEAVALGVVGALPGLLVAQVLVDTTLALAAGTLPRSDEVVMDLRVMAFAGSVAVALAVVASLATVVLRRAGVAGALRDRAARAGGGPAARRIRSGLVVVQVGAAVVLLVAGGLLARSYRSLSTKEMGFDEAVLVVSLQIPQRYADVPERLALGREIGDALEPLAEVAGVTVVDAAPLGGHSNVPLEVFGRGGNDPNDETDRVLVGPGYFEAMGARMVQGRSLGTSDDGSGAPVAVVNETFARRYLPGGALGERVRQGPDDPSWRTVVGVVADMRQQGAVQPVAPYLYLPWAQVPEPGPMSLVVRPEPGAGPLDRVVRNAIHGVDPSIAVRAMETVARRLDDELTTPRLQFTLMALFAGTAFLLALIGVFGVVSHGVRSRRRELAIRLSLGADGHRLVREIVVEGLVLGAAGVGLGTLAALGVAGVMERFLFGISARDPATLVAISVALLSATALASWLPARQARRLEPSVTLREE